MKGILSNPVQSSFPELVMSGQRLMANTPYDHADLQTDNGTLLRVLQNFKKDKSITFFKRRCPVASCYKTSLLYLRSVWERRPRHLRPNLLCKSETDQITLVTHKQTVGTLRAGLDDASLTPGHTQSAAGRSAFLTGNEVEITEETGAQ